MWAAWVVASPSVGNTARTSYSVASLLSGNSSRKARCTSSSQPRAGQLPDAKQSLGRSLIVPQGVPDASSNLLALGRDWVTGRNLAARAPARTRDCGFDSQRAVFLSARPPQRERDLYSYGTGRHDPDRRLPQRYRQLYLARRAGARQ